MISKGEEVEQSLYRPGHALRFTGGWSSQISWQSVHEGGKVVRPHAPAAFTPQEILLVLLSVAGWVDRRAGRIMSIPMTSGIEAAAFRFAAQCLTQLRHCMGDDIWQYILLLLQIMVQAHYIISYYIILMFSTSSLTLGNHFPLISWSNLKGACQERRW